MLAVTASRANDAYRQQMMIRAHRALQEMIDSIQGRRHRSYFIGLQQRWQHLNLQFKLQQPKAE